MTSPLLGRANELHTLQQHLAHTCESGQPSVVLVRGEPGIGKSTLLKSFMDSAPGTAGGRPILVGYGQSMTNSLGSDAFQAVRECLRSLVSGAERHSSQESFMRVVHAVRHHAPDWLESVPLVGTLLAAGVKTGQTIMHPGSSSAEQLNSRLDQLTALVSELFTSGPVVLVLDDLHWADSATIDIVMALALKVEGPLMLVLAYRADDLRPGRNGEPHPLTRVVFRLRRYRPGCAEIDLAPLSAADTRTLILSAATGGTVTGPAITEDDVQLLVRQSAGIPLFAESLAVVHGHGTGPAGGANDPPPQIGAVMEERLSFASPDDQRLLEAAIVVGFTFEVQFLADLARVDIDEVYDRLDGLMREHHLIVEAEPVGALDRYALNQPLLGDVLRQRSIVNTARWRRYHRRLVDILLAQTVSDELAVRAAAAAAVAQDPRAAALGLDAARRQYQAGAITKARELAEVALSLTSAQANSEVSTLPFDAAELLARSLSAEANHRGVAEVCAQALGQLQPGIVPEGRVHQLRLLQIRSLRMANEWPEAAKLENDLEAQLPPEALALRAEVLMLRAEFALCGPQQDVRACISLCDDVTKLTDDRELTSRAHGHRGLAHLADYDPDQAERWLRSAIDVARTDRHPYSAYEAMHWLSKKKIACLELDEAWLLLQQLEEMSEASGVASDNPFHRRDAGRVLALSADTTGAGTAFVQFFDLVAHHQQDRALTVLACQAAEMDGRHGASTTDAMLDVIEDVNTDEATRAEQEAVLAESVRQLRHRPSDWQAVPFVINVLGVDRHEAHAAEAIFRFDVPDLARLRRQVTGS